MQQLVDGSAACGILVDTAGSFEHIATAWSPAPGEWVSVWPHEHPPGDTVQLLVAHSGEIGALTAIEHDGCIIGFQGPEAPATLQPAEEGGLHKRAALQVVGYPSVIDHPAFQLHRGSLDAERYQPYCCPWTIQGHLALFSADTGYLTGRFYAGMAGSPVLHQSRVVGVLLDGEVDLRFPPLARFHRLR